MNKQNLAVVAVILCAAVSACIGIGVNSTAQATDNAPATNVPAEPPKPDQPKSEPPKAEQPKAELPAVPAGEVREDGLRFAVPYDRGEGSLKFARQNDLLRVDVEVRFPYLAGDGTRERGSTLVLTLSVDGLNGRQLFFYPSPVWDALQSQGRAALYRTEAAFSKAEGMRPLAEEPSFGGTADVKYWDRWKATLFVDLRFVVVSGSTPAAVADSWFAGLFAGTAAVHNTVYPAGMDRQNPGKAPDRLVKFKFSELPKLKDQDANPRETAIAAENAQQDDMLALLPLLKSRDFAGFQKQVKTLTEKYSTALWPRFLACWIVEVAMQYRLEGVELNRDVALQAYADACPGQSHVHLMYLNSLLSAGKHEDARKYSDQIFASALCKGSTLADAYIRAQFGSMLVQQGYLDDGAVVLKHLQANESLAKDAGLLKLVETLRTAHEAAVGQWNEELKFREADTKKTNPRLTFETTQGKFVVELFEDDAPNTVASLVALTQAKFYDGLTFHRFVQNFVIQGGCPKGDGEGGPGYRLKSEVSKRNHFRGMFGMACTGPKTNTEGSQFYVCLSNGASVKNLSGNYVIAGRVIEGMEVVDKLRQGDKMKTVVASSLRDHKYEPVKIKE